METQCPPGMPLRHICLDRWRKIRKLQETELPPAPVDPAPLPVPETPVDIPEPVPPTMDTPIPPYFPPEILDPFVPPVYTDPYVPPVVYVPPEVEIPPEPTVDNTPDPYVPVIPPGIETSIILGGAAATAVATNNNYWPPGNNSYQPGPAPPPAVQPPPVAAPLPPPPIPVYDQIFDFPVETLEPPVVPAVVPDQGVQGEDTSPSPVVSGSSPVNTGTISWDKPGGNVLSGFGTSSGWSKRTLGYW